MLTIMPPKGRMILSQEGKILIPLKATTSFPLHLISRSLIVTPRVASKCLSQWRSSFPISRAYRPLRAWQPHGRCFKRMDEKHNVFPRFSCQNNYTSFRRQLNRWGFQRIIDIDGPDQGTYYHELLLRGKPSYLWHTIERLTSTRKTARTARLPMRRMSHQDSISFPSY